MTRQITINNTEGFAARIQNRGQSNGTQTVELYKDGILVTDEANLTLTPDETAYVLEAPTVFSNTLHQQVLTMEVVTANMTRTIEVLINAIPDSVVEDFEDNDISNYSGDTGSFQTTTSPVYNGSYALEETYTGNESASIADVNITISEDKLYQAAIRPVKNKVTSVLFMAQSPSFLDAYEVGYYHDGDEFRTPVGTATIDLTLSDWFIVEFEKLSNGTVNCRLLDTNQNELASTTGIDDSYTSGGLGFYVNNVNTTDGGNAAYDYIVRE